MVHGGRVSRRIRRDGTSATTSQDVRSGDIDAPTAHAKRSSATVRPWPRAWSATARLRRPCAMHCCAALTAPLEHCCQLAQHALVPADVSRVGGHELKPGQRVVLQAAGGLYEPQPLQAHGAHCGREDDIPRSAQRPRRLIGQAWSPLHRSQHGAALASRRGRRRPRGAGSRRTGRASSQRRL